MEPGLFVPHRHDQDVKGKVPAWGGNWDPVRGSSTREKAMALEPVAGQVYFSPECHAAYAALGFSPSPGSLRAVCSSRTGRPTSRAVVR